MINLKRTALIGMVLMLTFVITACSSSSDIVTFTGDRPVRGEVSGEVVDTFEDSPIEGAGITDGNSTTRSGDDGSYVLYGVYDGAEISVEREGFESDSRIIEIEKDNDELKDIDFSLYQEYSDDNDESDDQDQNDNENEDILISVDLIFELSWQEGAEDLDAHLLVPDQENSEQEGYHIYYPDENRGTLNDYPYALLNDDIRNYDEEKPETIKIEKLYEGRYIYFVKNFSEDDADGGEEVPEISDSEAMVRVRENGEWTEYKPENQTGMHWLLFEIIVDEDGYDIEYINEFTDDEPGLN